MTARDRRNPPAQASAAPESRTSNESSVLFSLRELMDLEHDRIDDERAREERALVEANRAKMEAELRIAAADEARRRADAERRRAEEMARKEEDARLEAMQLAAVERARLEAIERGRLEQVALEHRHEEAMLRLKAERDRVMLKRTTLGLLAVAMTCGAAALGYYVGVVRPRVAAEQRELIDRNAQLEAEVRAQADGLDQLGARSARLRDDLESIASAPAAPTVPPTAATATPQPTVVRPLPSAPPTATANSRPCDPRDPMDFCLGR